jgi:hypothetical protein
LPEVKFVRWLYGTPVAPGSLKGKVVLFHMWESGSYGGSDPIGQVVDVYSRYRDRGLVVVSMVSPYYDDTILRKKVLEHKIAHTVAMLGEMRSNLWWMRTLNKLGAEPYVPFIVVDRKGYAVSAPNQKDLESAIQNVLGE